jgi:hypothetical protein
LIGHPITLIVAKQIVAGGGSDRAASLNKVIENDGVHFFKSRWYWASTLWR